jgi:hypothetical protein
VSGSLPHKAKHLKFYSFDFKSGFTRFNFNNNHFKITKPNILPLISNQNSQDLISAMVITRFIVKEIIFMALHQRKVIENSSNASNATKAPAEEFSASYRWLVK